MNNAYELLECSTNSSQEEIKSNYHRLLLKYHPDKLISNKSEENAIDKFLQIQSAFKLLFNAQTRHEYDSLLRQIELKKKASQIKNLDDVDDEQQMLLTIKDDFELNNEKGAYFR
jgi:DnaJ-class molecular chaperone